MNDPNNNGDGLYTLIKMWCIGGNNFNHFNSSSNLMKTIIGRKYQPSDNSYSVNLTESGDYPYKNNHPVLAGNMHGASPKICTVLSEPFKSVVRHSVVDVEKTMDMVVVESEGQTYVVLYNENNLID